jgi:tetratricopeptide (TPR) repeat protein
VAALETNIALQPMSPYGYYQLGMTYHHLGRAKEARRIVERLREFEPKYAATLERDVARTPAHTSTAAASATASPSSPADHPQALPGIA